MPIMNRSMYRVEMSTDGNHKVVVTIDDPNGTEAALAWAQATYYKLVRDLDNDSSRQEAFNEEVPPECSIHRQPMTKVQGKLGPFSRAPAHHAVHSPRFRAR